MPTKSTHPKKCCLFFGDHCCSSDKFLPWLLSILFTILITASAIYAYQAYLSRKPQVWVEPPFTEAPTETPVSSTDTSTWQTYRNDQLGFEIQYPSTVSVTNELNDKYNRYVSFAGQDLQFSVRLKTPSTVSESKLENYLYLDNPIKSKGLLEGQIANIYKSSTGYCDGPSCGSPFVTFVTQKNGDYYILQFDGDVQVSDIENQILSTFRFTN